MEIPVIVGNRLRYRIRWRFARLRQVEDGYELGIWGHPALKVGMTPSGFEFTQIEWYTFTFSFHRRRLLRNQGGDIQPARILLGWASNWFGFLYLAIYLTDWSHMVGLGELPLDVGRLSLGMPD